MEPQKKKKSVRDLGRKKRMSIPLVLEVNTDKPLQLQIFDQIRNMIFDGRLKGGDSLPASRMLSEQIGVSRNTTLLAYERLLAEGYIETKPSVGTFVSRCLPDETMQLTQPILQKDKKAKSNLPPVRFLGPVQRVFNPNRADIDHDFWIGRPDPDSFPLHQWRRLIAQQLLRLGTRLTEYGDPAGYYPLRQAIADHLGPSRGIITSPENIIIVGGSQEGLNLIARLLQGPKTPVILEQPCYQGAAYVFESYNALIHPIPVDRRGMLIDQLPNVKNAICYVTPSHQYPTGVTLSLNRRLHLLEWAARTGSCIIEDDYDSDFRYQGAPLTALKGLDGQDNVIYLGTFSKSIGAGIRIGYMIVPSGLIKSACRLKGLMNNGQPILEQAALVDFMEKGGYSRHLRVIRRRYEQRRDSLVEALKRNFGDVDLMGLRGGMHLTWRLPDSFPSPKTLEAIALRQRVGLYSLKSAAAVDFGATAFSKNLIALGYSSLNEKDIHEAIDGVAFGLEQYNLENRSVN